MVVVVVSKLLHSLLLLFNLLANLRGDLRRGKVVVVIAGTPVTSLIRPHPINVIVPCGRWSGGANGLVNPDNAAPHDDKTPGPYFNRKYPQNRVRFDLNWLVFQR